MIIPIIIFLLFLLALVAITLLSGHQLVKRRPPDPPDSPANHGLPYEDVAFPSRYKAMLRGWWIAAAAESRGTVIICHGQGGSMEADLPQAVPLHKAGYNVLMFNFRAHGNSEGDEVTFGVFEKEDLLGAIDFVRHEKRTDKVALLGLSMGAGVAMITAALTDKVSVIILDGIFERFLDVVRAAGTGTVAGPLASVMAQLAVLGATILTNTRMYQVSPSLWARHVPVGVPVLFIHGERDQFTSLEAVKRLAADLQSLHNIWVAGGSLHRDAFKDHTAAYNQQVLDWLAAHYA